MAQSVLPLASLVALAAHMASATAADISTLDHIIFFMQENRAFDHYFGTMHGVRGFQDPNAHVLPNGKPVWYQRVDGTLSNDTDFLMPFWMNEAGGKYANSTQCAVAGSNGFANNHGALHNGANDLWALGNTPYSLGYFREQDIPVQYAIANGWTVADMYQQGVISSTNPNRVMLWSGSINVPGGNVNSSQGPVLDNNGSPGCISLTVDKGDSTLPPAYWGANTTSKPEYSCWPYDWKTVPEYLEERNISWFTYQAYDNFGDQPLASFKRYIDLSADWETETDPLVYKALAMTGGGNSLGGLDHFLADAAAGTLPAVSWIVGPAELSEHPPYSPRDGAWLQAQIVDAVQKSPAYARTALLVSFDETGGWADHVVPFHSPPGTPGEWLADPFSGNQTFAGPGYRLPFYIVSPYTRGGNVFTAPADHTSQIMFLEKWAAAKGHAFESVEINTWRREHMSDLTEFFDFAHPDLSHVHLPNAPTPHTDPLTSMLDGAEWCQAVYNHSIQPPVPYGEQSDSTLVEYVQSGFKVVRGGLTEGRYLVLETGSHALTFSGSAVSLAASAGAKRANAAAQRLVAHASDSSDASANTFTLAFAGAPADAAFVGPKLTLVGAADAATFVVVNLGGSKGYMLQVNGTKEYVAVQGAKVALASKGTPFVLYAVTF